MFRLISLAITAILVGSGGWWSWHNIPQVRNFVEQNMSTGKFITLEAMYTPDQIMEKHKKDLLPAPEYSYQQPILYFSPYLLMDVKYVKNERFTGEGIILWSEEDGEMVTDTKKWVKTHGFEDCINAKANREDFKLINALARHKNPVSREQLLEDLFVEHAVLDKWIESCRKKNLVIRQGNKYRLHFDKPLIWVTPETKVNQWLVTKPHKGTNRRARTYNESQIKRISLAAFGQDFAIRSISEVFLPIYEIKVTTPDGSTLTTYWNAVNGERIQNTI